MMQIVCDLCGEIIGDHDKEYSVESCFKYLTEFEIQILSTNTLITYSSNSIPLPTFDESDNVCIKCYTKIISFIIKIREKNIKNG